VSRKAKGRCSVFTPFLMLPNNVSITLFLDTFSASNPIIELKRIPVERSKNDVYQLKTSRLMRV